MNILAFMQCPWFPEGTELRNIELYQTNQDFHRALLKKTMSGHRLHVAFGEAMFSEIYWDNVSPASIGKAAGRTKTDMKHVEAVIREQRPNIILCFGEQAREAVESSIGAIPLKVMSCHHPNARHRTQADLDEFAQSVRVVIREMTPVDL